MSTAGILVFVGGLAITGVMGWFFFGPKKAHSAEVVGDVQEIRVTVKGGYTPDLVRARQGVPLRIVFDRQESGECTSRVVFPDFALNQPLPAYAQTAVELMPDRAGEFGFACGMNMVHGKLLVTPNGHAAPPAAARAARAQHSEPKPVDAQPESPFQKLHYRFHHSLPRRQ